MTASANETNQNTHIQPGADMAERQAAPTEDRVIWRMDLQKKLNVTSNTVLRWMKAGKLPPPDVDLSRKTKGWKLSTLTEAGIRLA